MKLTDKFKPLAGIYILRCTINGKYYIGETLNIQERMKDHAYEKKQVIHKAIKKYGINSFEIEVYYLPDFDKESLLDLEEQLIIKFNSLSPNGYNVCRRGQDSTGTVRSEETKEKIRQANLGKKQPEEQKLKRSVCWLGENNPNYGKPLSAEHKQKLSDSKKGKKKPPRSEEHCRKISENNRKRIVTEETRQKQRQRVFSPETRAKMRESRRLYLERKDQSESRP